MLRVPGIVTERRNPCALHSEVIQLAWSQPPSPPTLVLSLSDWPFLGLALSGLEDPEGAFEESKDGQGQPWCYSSLRKHSALFHAPASWSSSLCLPAPAPRSVQAVSVSFHSLHGAGLHCSYEHRLSRLWAQVQLAHKKPQVGLRIFLRHVFLRRVLASPFLPHISFPLCPLNSMSKPLILFLAPTHLLGDFG